MIPIKKPEEIEIMKEGGKISSLALHTTVDSAKVGITTMELNKIAEKIILGGGGEPSFKKVEDYAYATCININDGVVHGIPGNYQIKEGDIVSIDLGVFYKGFHTDVSHTIEVGTKKEDKFLNAGKKALEEAIFHCSAGNKLGSISYSIQRNIERFGYSVSRELVGHGVGRELHEDPYVPGYGRQDQGPLLKEGMVLAIEIIYQKGKPYIELDTDGWTLRTADGSLSGLFESTVAVTKNGPLILAGF
jgi:methionyl aminopeptidase